MKSECPFVLTACSHFKAQPVGPPEGNLVNGGRWQFATRYHCADCDAYFTETHDQLRPPDLSKTRRSPHEDRQVRR